MVAGENWTDHYYFVNSLSSGKMSGLFVVAFYALSNFVLVALFVAVILSNFETKKNEVDKEQADAYDRLWKLVHRTCKEGV